MRKQSNIIEITVMCLFLSAFVFVHTVFLGDRSIRCTKIRCIQFVTWHVVRVFASYVFVESYLSFQKIKSKI